MAISITSPIALVQFGDGIVKTMPDPALDHYISSWNGFSLENSFYFRISDLLGFTYLEYFQTPIVRHLLRYIVQY